MLLYLYMLVAWVGLIWNGWMVCLCALPACLLLLLLLLLISSRKRRRARIF
jgi:hypothetical protein